MPSSMYPTRDLPQDPIFSHISEHSSVRERIDISHERAKAIALKYNLTADDLIGPSQKFWDMYTDPIVTVDGGAVTLFSIQLNLVGGLIAPHLKVRPDLHPFMEDILAFRISAQFLLSEVGHGLDAANIETTVTLLPNGLFELHTPNPRAAKYMPPTLPCGGVPRVGIVMARLIVESRDLGIRPFIVPLNDGIEMCSGILAKELPSRVGCKAVGHAITYFSYVQLPRSALLGPLEMQESPRIHFLKSLWRVGIGSICLAGMVAPALQVAAFVAARYSQRRTITGRTGQPMAIIQLRTQQLPILHALAQGVVLEALYRETTTILSSLPLEKIDERNAICTIVKATMIGHWRRTGCTLADRCGAQGMFEFNQLLPMETELRGVAIAEGDVLALSIRLAFELALGRYTIPSGCGHNNDLVLHEHGLKADLQNRLRSKAIGKDDLNNPLMPMCVPFVEAIGHRMALEAAMKAGISSDLVNLYKIGVVACDLPWYIENAGWSRARLVEEEEDSLSPVFQNIEQHLCDLNVEPYAVASLTSAKSWDRLEAGLRKYEGQASYVLRADSRCRL